MLHRLHIDYKIRSMPKDKDQERNSLIYFLMRYKPYILNNYVENNKKESDFADEPI